jgi:hypothetical protein
MKKINYQYAAKVEFDLKNRLKQIGAASSVSFKK